MKNKFKFETYKRIIVLCLFFILPVLACATQPVVAKPVGEVRIGSHVIFRYYGDNSSETELRADRVQKRIENLLGGSLGPDDVRIVKQQNRYSIYWGSEHITSVDSKQARFNNSTPESLARIWAGNFKLALQQNKFFLIPSSVEMSPGSTVEVKARGLARGPITIEQEAENVLIDIDSEFEKINLKAVKPGKSRIVFRQGDFHASLKVNVLESAAEIPEKIETQVFGDPVPVEVLKFAAINAVRDNILLKPGAEIQIGGKILASSRLGRGEYLKTDVPIYVKGEKYLPVEAKVPVIIKNTGRTFSPIKKVIVSDRPEAFKEDGILLKSDFDVSEPSRLLYFHKNASPQPRRLWIELKNDSLKTTRVMLSGSVAGPSRWGVTVGHEAAMRFLESYRDYIGFTVKIPPRSRKTLVNLLVPPEQVAAGYLHMEIIEGEKLEVLVKNSTPDQKETASLPLLYEPFNPFRIHPRGVFTPAQIEKEVTFTVGTDEEAACVMGRAPWLIDQGTGEPNNGNYGVFYRFNLKIENPTNKKRRIGFYFEPTSVLARGSFILNGKLMETGVVRKPSKRLFAVLELNPGEKRQMELISTPEGGSYYPVRISLKTVSNNLLVDEELDNFEEDEEDSEQLD